MDGEDTIVRIRADAAHGSQRSSVRVERGPATRGEALGYPIDGRQPVLIPDPQTWARSRRADEPLSTLISNVRASSAMEIPIVVGDRIVGSIVLLSGEWGRRYEEADLQVAVDLARQTAFALENSRLYSLARAATQARDEMLGIVAHDLRSPLAAAQLAASVLARQVPEDRREASRKPTEAIRRSIRQANRLVQDLLDVARLEAGTLDLQLKEVSPEVIVHNALDGYVGLAADAALTIDADIAPGLALVIADEDRIQQVLGNLLDNAIKFTPAGGVVRLAVQRDAEAIRFAVSDTGPGISPDHLPHVFDRFWQERAADRRGAGLGLAIAKGIVERHGGRMAVDSVPGEGSTFAFTLPVLAAAGPPSSRPWTNAAEG
jgi:signal transduction histidine kinase